MTTWILVQIFFNILLALGFFVIWTRLSKRPKDDPRLSRGLQLLQSKISVLEDLSDRTEAQVTQLTALLEKKGAQLQTKILDAQDQIREIDQSMQKSMEVAEIFQDKIPHEEIVERQNTIKYVKAAKMAHEGLEIKEIAEAVDLPLGEIEFIAKVNRDQLMFDEDSLPAWVKEKAEGEGADWALDESVAEGMPVNNFGYEVTDAEDIENIFKVPEADYASLKKVGDEFRRACEAYEVEKSQRESKVTVAEHMFDKASAVVGEVREKLVEKAEEVMGAHQAKPKSRISVKVLDESEISSGEEAVDLDIRKEPKTVATEVKAKPVSKSKAKTNKKSIKPSVPTHFVPDSYVKQELKVNRDEQQIIDAEQVKKVKFPSLDLNDNLG